MSVTDEKQIWDFLKSKGLNDYAIAGVMGNLYAESGLRANNLQNTYEKKFGMTDMQYAESVDNGKYTNFIKDGAGYGLAQWTYWSRKQALLEFCKVAKTSIGDLTMQLNFLWKELQRYKSVMNVLNSAKSIKEASNVVLLQYERPADQSVTVQNKREQFGKVYYDKYAVKSDSGKGATGKMNMSRIEEFIAFLKSRVGCSLYVWGAQGEKTITESWIARRESDNQKQVKRVLAFWDKLKAQGITDIQAFDCSGLIMYWLQNTKGYLKNDMSAAGLCSTCKSIAKADLKAGDLVFHHNGTKVAHVGVFVGNGNVIHCKGRDVGVIEEAIGKYSWNRFGRLAVLQENDVTATQPVIPASVRDLKLSVPMMRGDDVKTLQARLIVMGYDLGTSGADGVYGSKTDLAVKLFQNRAKAMKNGICDEAMRLTLGI
jgi:cell wall-associated NlpC family hydrolase